jgi:hypothetical protein
VEYRPDREAQMALLPNGLLPFRHSCWWVKTADLERLSIA